MKSEHKCQKLQSFKRPLEAGTKSETNHIDFSPLQLKSICLHLKWGQGGGTIIIKKKLCIITGMAT